MTAGAPRDPDGNGEDRPDRAGSGDRATRQVTALGRDLAVRIDGRLASVSARRVEQTTRKLDEELTATVEALASGPGRIDDVHAARLIQRAIDYHDRTDGAFEVRRGEGRVGSKADVGCETDPAFDRCGVDEDVDDAVAVVAPPVDVGSMVDGYLVDRVVAAARKTDREAVVATEGIRNDAEGVEIVRADGSHHLTLSCDWSMATDGSHDPDLDGGGQVRIGTDEGRTVVLSGRDATEAAALQSIVAGEDPRTGLEYVEAWPDADAIFVHGGIVRTTDGFENHRA